MNTLMLLLLLGDADPAILAENKKAARECEERHDRQKKKVGDLTRRGKVTVKKTTSKFRFGGGAGYKGFGGSGGYAGYNTDVSGAAGGIGSVLYNFGYGYGNPGNHRSEEHEEVTEEREMIWPDRSYYGGPLTVKNPFK
jgi:hypothetical protein